MMRRIEAEFEFDIGDIVYFKVAAHRYQRYAQPFIVVGLEANVCPGSGVQKLYHLDTLTSDEHMSKRVHEISLSKYKPKYQPVSHEEVADHALGLITDAVVRGMSAKQVVNSFAGDVISAALGIELDLREDKDHDDDE